MVIFRHLTLRSRRITIQRECGLSPFAKIMKEWIGFFSMAVIVALAMFVEIAMVVRLTRRGISCNKLPKLPWWGGRGHEVAATYEQVFPRSRLPIFRRFVFCLFPAWAGVYLLIVLWK